MSEGFGRDSRRAVEGFNKNPNSFGGYWEGIVVNDKDPQQKGRLQIRILDLHDDTTPDESLPWVPPNFPSASASTTNTWANSGFFQCPAVNAMVGIMFKKGDPGFPVWIGGWFVSAPGLLGRELYGSNGQRKALYNKNGQPSCPTWRSLRGHVIELDDDSGTLRITSLSGHKITLADGTDTEHGDCIKLEDRKGNFVWMKTASNVLAIKWAGDVDEDFSGNVSQKIGGNLTQTIGGTWKMGIGGQVTIFAGGLLAIDALPNINLNCGIATNPSANSVPAGSVSGGANVQSVLASLGNTIRKIMTGT